MTVTWSISANLHLDDVLSQQRPPLSAASVKRLRNNIDFWASALAKKNQTKTFNEGSASVAVKASPNTVVDVSLPTVTA
jgi:hypothetical protein